MVRAKPPHLHAKFLRRSRLTLSEPMEKRLNAFHRKIPSISKATLARIARKDSRILEITPKTFACNVRRTSNLLNATLPAFFTLARSLPALIYQDPWSMRLKLYRIAKGLETRPKDLLPVVRKKPTLLSRSEASLFSAIDEFAARFDVALPAARKYFLRHPSLFSVTLATIEHNIQTTAHLLELPLPLYTKAALAQPQLFYQAPQTILSNITETARNLDIPFHSFLTITLSQPSLMTRSPSGMRRKARLIRYLMHYTRDHRTFEEFLHASKAALTYSPQRILARCIIARLHLSTLRASTLLVMPNKTANLLLRQHLKSRLGAAAYPVYRRWKAAGLLTPD